MPENCQTKQHTIGKSLCGKESLAKNALNQYLGKNPNATYTNIRLVNTERSGYSNQCRYTFEYNECTSPGLNKMLIIGVGAGAIILIIAIATITIISKRKKK